MKNQVLHNLNFQELLAYPDEFQPKFRYNEPICCSRFCIECEASGTLAKAGGTLTLMSHGCATDDFEKILGPTTKPSAVASPIMFLLEDPGGDHSDLGKELSFGGIVKKPPVKHYYWSPSLESWPQSMEEVIKNGNFYGSYFAYIIQKHALSNVYITNLVKCKRVDVHNGNLVEEKCVSHWLVREVSEFSPSIVFCFSRKVFDSARRRFPALNCEYLYHPSFIQNRSYTQGMSPSQAMTRNDQIIAAKIRSLTP